MWEHAFRVAAESGFFEAVFSRIAMRDPKKNFHMRA